MAKLTKHHFSDQGADGQRDSFESDIYVDTDGEFSATVPDYLVPALQSCAKRLGHGVRLLKVNYRAFAPSKGALVQYVQTAHAEYLACEETSEFVICYDWFAEVSYWVKPDGTLCENGAVRGAGTYETGGDWGKGRRRDGSSGIDAANSVKQYSVGLFASVYKRTTYRRPSSETVRYVRLYQNNGLSEDNYWAKRLTGFCCLAPSRAPEQMQHMPLSEDAARFFFDSLLAMAEIGRRFSTFFGSQDNVLAAIAGRGPSLLAAPAAPVLE